MGKLGMSRATDLTGQLLGKLLVIKRVENSAGRQSQWLCNCSCGNSTVVQGTLLKRGVTKSCGCLIGESNTKRFTTHGHIGKNKPTKAYTTWRGMLKRCDNPKAANYKWYGALGVTVCERWYKFENFLEDMGEPPEGLELERKLNSEGYCKENCLWDTRKNQLINRKNTLWVILPDARKITVKAASEELGIPYRNLKYNLQKHSVYKGCSLV